MKRDIEKYTKIYLDDEFEAYAVFYRRKKVLEILNNYKPKNVLEIGCGAESIFGHYKSYDKAYIVEPSEEFCSINKKADFFNEKITIINDFAENTYDRLKDISFDFIIISSLIHELEDPDKLIEIVKKLANKDTLIHINVPNTQSFHLLWAKEAGLIKNAVDLSETAKKYQRHHTYNINTLKEYCQEMGLDVINSGSYFMKIFNNAKMVACIKNDLIDEKLLDGLDSLIKYFPNNGSEIYVNCKINS